MRVLVVGASGMIGSAVVEELAPHHDVVTAGRNSGDVRLDLTDPASIVDAYEKTGELGAVVCCAGSVKFAPFSEMNAEDYDIGYRNKLMGQVNLVLLGRDRVTDGGSFTLTTGILDRKPILRSTSASMVNGAINGFVQAAGLDMPRGQRINAVSPGVIEEAMDRYGDMFEGFAPVPASLVAKAYAACVDGDRNGMVLKVP